MEGVYVEEVNPERATGLVTVEMYWLNIISI